MVLADNATAAMAQSWLVHGIAAIALVWLVAGALRVLPPGRLHARIGGR